MTLATDNEIQLCKNSYVRGMLERFITSSIADILKSVMVFNEHKGTTLFTLNLV